MKIRLCVPLVLSAALFAGAAAAADYAVIVIEKPVKAPLDATWKRVSPYCSLSEWLGVACEISAGNGRDVGSIRKIDGGRVTEVMVAKTDYSYTYAFPEPTPTFYHGTLAAVSTGPHTSKIVYTLLYDQEPLPTPEARAQDRERRTKRFTEGVEKMVALVEAR